MSWGTFWNSAVLQMETQVSQVNEMKEANSRSQPSATASGIGELPCACSESICGSVSAMKERETGCCELELHLGPVYASLSPGLQNTEVSVFWALSRCPLSRSRQNHFKPQPKSSVDTRYAAPDVRGMAVSWVGCNNCRTPPLAFPFISLFSPLPLDISVVLLGSSWPK